MRNNRRQRAAIWLRSIFLLGLFFIGDAAGAVSAEGDASGPVSPPPIILPPTREDYGDWTVDIREHFIFAYTDNGSRNPFGVVCGSTCVAFVRPAETCKEEEVGPIMVNGSAGAYLIEGRCRTVKGMTVFLAKYSEPLRNTVEAGGVIGLGFPIADARFSATGYSLVGATKAIQRAMDLAEEHKKRGEELLDFPL